MRLGTCIALELAIAAGAMGGVVLAVGHASRLAGPYLRSTEAAAATVAPAQPPASLLRLPAATLELAPVALAPPGATVFGAPDDVLLAPLGEGAVTKLRINHGGTSLSLRVDFASGARAAFKPEQTHPQSDPRREIAAYRLDRLLGIGRVPPAKPIALPLAALLDATEPSHRRHIAGRLADEAIVHDGVVRGELSWWIPEIKLAELDGEKVDDQAGKARWTAYLQIGAIIPPAARPLVAQIAQVIVFDVLIDNPDRWTGGNTVMSPDRRVFYFMDNTMSFSTFGFGHRSNLLALRRIQVFPRALVERMRTLTEAELAGALATGDDLGLAPLLDADEIHAVIVRRDNMLRYIDQVIAEHGEDAVLALP